MAFVTRAACSGVSACVTVDAPALSAPRDACRLWRRSLLTIMMRPIETTAPMAIAANDSHPSDPEFGFGDWTGGCVVVVVVVGGTATAGADIVPNSSATAIRIPAARMSRPVIRLSIDLELGILPPSMTSNKLTIGEVPQLVQPDLLLAQAHMESSQSQRTGWCSTSSWKILDRLADESDREPP